MLYRFLSIIGILFFISSNSLGASENFRALKRDNLCRYYIQLQSVPLPKENAPLKCTARSIEGCTNWDYSPVEFENLLVAKSSSIPLCSIGEIGVAASTKYYHDVLYYENKVLMSPKMDVVTFGDWNIYNNTVATNIVNIDEPFLVRKYCDRWSPKCDVEIPLIYPCGEVFDDRDERCSPYPNPNFICPRWKNEAKCDSWTSKNYWNQGYSLNYYPNFNMGVGRKEVSISTIADKETKKIWCIPCDGGVLWDYSMKDVSSGTTYNFKCTNDMPSEVISYFDSNICEKRFSLVKELITDANISVMIKP